MQVPRQVAGTVLVVLRYPAFDNGGFKGPKQAVIQSSELGTWKVTARELSCNSITRDALGQRGRDLSAPMAPICDRGPARGRKEKYLLQLFTHEDRPARCNAIQPFGQAQDSWPPLQVVSVGQTVVRCAGLWCCRRGKWNANLRLQRQPGSLLCLPQQTPTRICNATRWIS